MDDLRDGLVAMMCCGAGVDAVDMRMKRYGQTPSEGGELYPRIWIEFLALNRTALTI
jgi:hypothetical protein